MSFGHAPDEFHDKLIEQANTTRWVWREHMLSIAGACSGMPRQWLVYGKKHTRYFDEIEDGAAFLQRHGFTELSIRSEEFIPNWWRHTDGAWARLIDGFEGPELDAVSAAGEELSLSQE